MLRELAIGRDADVAEYVREQRAVRVLPLRDTQCLDAGEVVLVLLDVDEHGLVDVLGNRDRLVRAVALVGEPAPQFFHRRVQQRGQPPQHVLAVLVGLLVRVVEEGATHGDDVDDAVVDEHPSIAVEDAAAGRLL